ncbi:MAG: ATP synthase F1 subunit gamma [Alphaproteobacteria bacterium]|nr:ATP synthase F1 subunit gamma [Alphaproteobacteria bacterium]
MANLKELRDKIGGIRSIRKVTSAMKLVAGVKFRKAEQKALASREYAAEVSKILKSIRRDQLERSYDLLDGRSDVKSELIIVFASDRGFCGNFNYSVLKEARHQAKIIQKEGKNLWTMCAGKKLRNAVSLLTEGGSFTFLSDFYKSDQMFDNALNLGREVINLFNSGKIDKVSVIYTHFYSPVRMLVKKKDLIPLKQEKSLDQTQMIFEPSVDEVLNDLLLQNIGIQLYQAALESVASEQSSRMSSMDNATRNADDMLSDLTIRYNRTRQYGITQELVEVVAGAEAIANE